MQEIKVDVAVSGGREGKESGGGREVRIEAARVGVSSVFTLRLILVV